MGEFGIETSSPDPESFLLDDSNELPYEAFEFGEITVEDGALRAPFTLPLTERSAGPLALLLGDIPTGTIYSCS